MYEDGEVDPFADEAMPEVAEVRPGEELDWASVERHLRAHLSPELTNHDIFGVRQFPNGAANLTYLISFGATELVLRRPPFGDLPPGAHDMKREHRVLSRLWQGFDKAPRAYLFCDDPAVAGADFFVMERRHGEVVRGVIPESMRHHPRVGYRISMALADAMAELHLVDPQLCGLSELGRPQGFVQRQVHGWKQRWDRVADTRFDKQMTAVHASLEASLPSPQRESFVHNDLKLDNCMIDSADPDRIAAIFDWDMATLGDPLVDLGTLLSYWPDVSDPAGAARASHDGMRRMGLPSRAELIARYAQSSGLDLHGISWYEAFAQWKTATVVQQLHHRWSGGDSTDPRMEAIAARIPVLAATAAELLR